MGLMPPYSCLEDLKDVNALLKGWFRVISPKLKLWFSKFYVVDSKFYGVASTK